MRRLPPGVFAINAFIDGQTVRLIVDSGDGVPGIALTTSAARKLKIQTTASTRPVRGIGGAEVLSSETGRAAIVAFGSNGSGTVALLDVPLQVANFPVLEGQALDKAGRLPVDGFLGADALRSCGAILEFPAQRLHFRAFSGNGVAADSTGNTEAMRALRTMTEIALRTDPSLGEPLWTVPVEINGKPATMLLDTGNWATRIASNHAMRFGLTPNGGAGLAVSDAAGTSVKTERAEARTFKVGSATVSPRVLLGPMGSWAQGDLIGTLGIDTLAASGAVIDCERGRLFLRSRPSL